MLIGKGSNPSYRPEPATAIAHIPALDGLRGIAILLVVTHHFGAVAGFAATGSMAGRFLERVFYTGWSGVDLFFVLSGFLISSVLLSSKGRPRYFRNFYGRRTLRIFPLYFGTLILGLILLLIFRLPPEYLIGQAPDHQGWLWTYTTNIALALGWVTSFGVFDLYWSLAIEEQFYLVWPMIVRFTRPIALAAICLAAALVALIWRLLWIESGGAWAGAYRFTATRIDALALGALAAVVARHPAASTRMARLAPWLLAGSLVTLVAMFTEIEHFYPSAPAVVIGGHSILAVFFACVVFLAGTRSTGWASAFAAPWLRWCGRVSYGVYVWHWPLRLVFDHYSPVDPSMEPVAQWRHAIAFLVVGVTGALILGWLSYHLYEKHFLRLKTRFTYAE